MAAVNTVLRVVVVTCTLLAPPVGVVVGVVVVGVVGADVGVVDLELMSGCS